MPLYEYIFGVYVKADNKDEAWEKVRHISEALDKIDAEGDSSVDGPMVVSPYDEFLHPRHPRPKDNA